MSLEDATPEDKPDNCEWFDETELSELERLAEEYNCKPETYYNRYTTENIRTLKTDENIITVSGYVFSRHGYANNMSSEGWSGISIRNIYIYSPLDIDTLLKCVEMDVGGGHKEVFNADSNKAVKLHFD